MASSVFYVLALAAGAALSFQVVINSQLRSHVGEPMQATLLSFCVGTLAAIIYCLIANYSWPSVGQLAQTPWWIWIGGLLGLFYLWCTVVVSPRLGVALTLGLVIAGQIAISTLIDHFGLLGAVVRQVSLGRIIGVVLIIAGVSLVAAFRE